MAAAQACLHKCPLSADLQGNLSTPEGYKYKFYNPLVSCQLLQMFETASAGRRVSGNNSGLLRELYGQKNPI